MLTLGCLVLTMIACGGKKKSDDIITEQMDEPKLQEPVRLQPYTDDRDIQWIGRGYHIAIHRESSDSLPMVKDEIGQQFVDNVITLAVSRQDGSVFYSHRFTKKDFDKSTYIILSVFLIRQMVTGLSLLLVSVIHRPTNIFHW